MTTTHAHTPGPWVVSDDGDVTLIIHAPKDEVDIARMSNDCEMFSEIRTNAHLIAAAPAMYEALKQLAELQRKWRSDDESETIDSIEYMDEIDKILWTDIISQAEAP